MTQDMNKEETAFKHPNCGGIILQHMFENKLIFECDLCGERTGDIDHLILRSLVVIRTGSRPSTPDQKIADEA